ncbi:MAG: hypothetical protein AAFQ42_01000, partial [Pseudomonadota bacterium]
MDAVVGAWVEWASALTESWPWWGKALTLAAGVGVILGAVKTILDILTWLWDATVGRARRAREARAEAARAAERDAAERQRDAEQTAKIDALSRSVQALLADRGIAVAGLDAGNQVRQQRPQPH